MTKDKQGRRFLCQVILCKLNTAAYLNMQAIESEDTALHLAARSGFDTIVRLLLRQPGINLFLKNKNGKSAMDVASTDAVKKVNRESPCFSLV